jgi:hypothetical protein
MQSPLSNSFIASLAFGMCQSYVHMTPLSHVVSPGVCVGLCQVTIMVALPPGSRARDVLCDYNATRIKFGSKGKAPIVDAAFPKRVKVSECNWTIGASRCRRPDVLQCAHDLHACFSLFTLLFWLSWTIPDDVHV